MAEAVMRQSAARPGAMMGIQQLVSMFPSKSMDDAHFPSGWHCGAWAEAGISMKLSPIAARTIIHLMEPS